MTTTGEERKDMEKNKAAILKESFALLDAEFGEKLTEQTRVYKKELFKKIIGQYPIEKIKKMMTDIVKTRKYNSFPKIAEMIEHIEGNKEEEVELAWMELKRILREEGYYNTVKFPQYPATGNIIVTMGGWLKFVEAMTDDQEKWIKKEFVKMYPAAKKIGNYPLSLPGYFEITNTRKGYEEQVLIAEFGMTIDGRKTNQRKRISQREKEVMPNERVEKKTKQGI